MRAGLRNWWHGVLQHLMVLPRDREQLVDVLRRAQSRELLGRDALDMIESVLQVADLRVRDVMVPRVQMAVVDRSQPIEEFLPQVIETAHSRFPVIDGDRDRVTGILLAKDLLQYFDPARTDDFNLRDMLRPAIFIPESKRLNVLLREFRASRNHMAIVVDEYGGVGGLVTIEDVLETIVGEIEDEHDVDDIETMIMPRGENVFVIKGQLSVEDFNEYFKVELDEEKAETIAGLVIAAIGELPRRGANVVMDSFRFDVVHADSRRIHLLRATRVDAS
ncbi:MAG: CBS domain-containing protein [Gammaproteobacteria bacterium]|jgi:magnesium and cobalt transporter|nr:CBS domain-containing protein [Gammaproteobacteria bacterium]